MKRIKMLKALYESSLLVFLALYAVAIRYVALSSSENVWLKRGMITLAIILFVIAVVKLVISIVKKFLDIVTIRREWRRGSSPTMVFFPLIFSLFSLLFLFLCL
jgi:hypothetical protein